MSPRDTSDLKKKVAKWAEDIGLKKAQIRLINAELSPSIAYQLTTGTYISEPKEKVISAILKAMGK